MVKMSYDVVKRWVNEAQEAASSDNIMVQVGGTPCRKAPVVCRCRLHRLMVASGLVQAEKNQSVHVDIESLLCRCAT